MKQYPPEEKSRSLLFSKQCVLKTAPVHGEAVLELRQCIFLLKWFHVCSAYIIYFYLLSFVITILYWSSNFYHLVTSQYRGDRKQWHLSQTPRAKGSTAYGVALFFISFRYKMGTRKRLQELSLLVCFIYIRCPFWQQLEKQTWLLSFTEHLVYSWLCANCYKHLLILFM
jgi:hypothetical protein